MSVMPSVDPSATGRTQYHNRHYFGERGWHAVEDDLVLGLQDEPRVCDAGSSVAELVALWCPEQTHEQTAAEPLVIHETPNDAFAGEVDGMVCACSFGDRDVELPMAGRLPAGEPVILERP